MAARFSDQQIATFLSEQKPVQAKPKHGHKEQELDITGADGNTFRLILRQSMFNHLDFSVILGVFPKESNAATVMVRCT